MFIQPHKRIYPSQIRLYDTCPRLYELEKVLRIPTVKNKKASFGEIVHAHLTDYFRYFPQDQVDQETIKKLTQEMITCNFISCHFEISLSSKREKRT